MPNQKRVLPIRELKLLDSAEHSRGSWSESGAFMCGVCMFSLYASELFSGGSGFLCKADFINKYLA